MAVYGYIRVSTKEQNGFNYFQNRNSSAGKGRITKMREAEWIPAAKELPRNGDECVLVQVSGRPQGNISLNNAFQLAYYDSTAGWVIEEYPEWEDADVIAWMPLPEPYNEQRQEGE